MLYYAPFTDIVSDLDLDELTPADENTERVLARLADWDDPCITLASYDQPGQRPGRSDHFYLAHDEQMAEQGKPFYLGVHLELDQSAGSVRATVRDVAMPELAEAWLISRGADPDRLRERVRPSEFEPADAQTEAAEAMLRHSGTRFDIHDSAFTIGPPYTTWVIALDSEAPDPALPVAVFVGHREKDSETFTLRLGHFASVEHAYDWTRHPDAPLPQTNPAGAARADAARIDRRTRPQREAAAGPADQPVPMPEAKPRRPRER
ncbi:hypothetical protein OU787_25935 [Kitasatospora sp. YST-16]|uniref:hypothetical protein n=1 Tax=unclassified Kitasatospora TaxID=2633591 RepID=UPI0004C43DE7|nr:MULTISPECIES: hypothetical protein [unclassified Kitasatospora]WAL74630.1 hypothetical protein OU787_25935 [Kitasatospora sp. YST-16]WNW40688.1 hypothetical protein RKE32_25870 [Streptomyces sp. Li-HN-5-13]